MKGKERLNHVVNNDDDGLSSNHWLDTDSRGLKGMTWRYKESGKEAEEWKEKKRIPKIPAGHSLIVFLHLHSYSSMKEVVVVGSIGF